MAPTWAVPGLFSLEKSHSAEKPISQKALCKPKSFLKSEGGTFGVLLLFQA